MAIVWVKTGSNKIANGKVAKAQGVTITLPSPVVRGKRSRNPGSKVKAIRLKESIKHKNSTCKYAQIKTLIPLETILSNDSEEQGEESNKTARKYTRLEREGFSWLCSGTRSYREALLGTIVRIL